MAISAYELLECVNTMTPEQCRELYDKLWGALEVGVMSDGMRRLSLHGHALDTIRGMEFLEEHQWHAFLERIRMAIALATPRQRTALAGELSAMLAEVKSTRAPTSLVSSAGPAAAPGGPDPGPIVPGADRPAGVASAASTAAVREQLEQHLLASRRVRPLIMSFDLSFVRHVEYVRDQVRGLTARDAARFIAGYLEPLRGSPEFAVVLKNICEDPVVAEVESACPDPRSLQAMVLDLGRRDDGPALEGNISWDGNQRPTPESHIFESNIGDGLQADGPPRIRVSPLYAPAVVVLTAAHDMDLTAWAETVHGKEQLAVDFDTDLGPLYGDPEARREFHLTLRDVIAPGPVMQAFVDRFSDRDRVDQNHLLLERGGRALELKDCLLVGHGFQCAASGLAVSDGLHIRGTSVYRVLPDQASVGLDFEREQAALQREEEFRRECLGRGEYVVRAADGVAIGTRRIADGAVTGVFGPQGPQGRQGKPSHEVIETEAGIAILPTDPATRARILRGEFESGRAEDREPPSLPDATPRRFVNGGNPFDQDWSE